ncbi:MAG: adenosine-specific kinase [Candidatus Zixiibacteriota bacterium]|nr:MAG: adenosine-specific kinase [candidate division Zixibacteria bacterium]
MNLEEYELKIPEGCNIIIGHSHFIKTAEDLYEAMISTSVNARFGIGFSEASQDRLVRLEGNDEELKKLAAEAIMGIGCGHTFIIYLKNAFPINFLGRIKEVPEVCRIICATANPIKVIIARTELGGGILGVIDGEAPVGIEKEDDIAARRKFLRDIGYKK